jgi:hypothetical protein
MAAVLGRKAMRVTTCIAVQAALIAAPTHAQSPRMCESAMEIANAAADLDKAVRAVDGRQADPTASAQQRAAYQENLRVRRQQAEQYAAAARSGVPLPAGAAATLRSELAADIEQWRAEFRVGRQDADAMRARWLVERDSLTAVQWAQRRVDWWAARDAWVAAHSREH